MAQICMEVGRIQSRYMWQLAEIKMGFILALLLFLAVEQSVMSADNTPLSIGPNGVEAIAVSPTAIDIYFTTEHDSLLLKRDGTGITEVAPNERKFRDENLSPSSRYIYNVEGLDSSPIVVSEVTYPAFKTYAVYDIIVVGASAAGTSAAVTAARMGASVALIEVTNRAGGMAANGLGATDIRNPARSNGFFEEFRQRIIAYYGGGDGLRYEPRVANAIIKSIAYSEPDLSFFRCTRATSAIMRDGLVVGVEVLDLDTGRTGQWYAKVVIDADVTADIAASAGVRFRIPREARSPEEPHAGHIYYDNNTGEILPGSTGEADERIQSYAYLLTVQDYGEYSDKTIPEPPFYNPDDYAFSPLWQQSWAFTSGRLPNDKFEINQHPWGTDLPGINYDYPYATFEQREEIDKFYRWRALGYLYYLQTVQGRSSLGLSEDEYPDNDNFPPALYVREARRMVGLATMNESDVSRARDIRVPTSIAVGDYPMDSHAVQDVLSPYSRDRGEGEWWLVRDTPWYRVPIGVIILKDAPGLLVPTAVSATHVAYGTLRMEPVRMSLGQAAGSLAALAVRYQTYPAHIPPAIVQDRLLVQKSYLTWFNDVNGSTRHFRAIQFLAVNGFFVGEEFRPDEPLTVEEAEWLLDRLILIRKYGPDVEDQIPPPLGGTPITRAQFADLLVSAMMQVEPDWLPEPTTFSHYADLEPGTEVSKAAEILYRHRIDSRAWAGWSLFDEELLFLPDEPITRADGAQAIWLAYRPTALKYN